MPSDAIDETFDLEKSLPQLPQELIDEILSYTFHLWSITYSRKHVQLSGYTPPRLLHFDRATREKFAAQFYANTVFHCRSETLLMKWLLSLPREHISLLRQVRFEGRIRGEGSKSSEAKACEAFRDRVTMRVRAVCPELRDGKFLTVWS